MIVTGLSVVFVLSVAGLSLFGLMGLVTFWFYSRHRQDPAIRPAIPVDRLPPVTVQLPVYNERYVIRRLIAAAASLTYPSERLQIQIIDDSTDDTTSIARSLVEAFRSRGIDITLIHRPHRQGYKAGALQSALDTASGAYIAVFDADFAPEPDFLLQTIPYFESDPQLGLVQTRWGHLNKDTSLLTKTQAIAVDKHFALDQAVRFRANLFPKFNGSAGVWRRACVEDAGGWEADTVCEDLCLSTRAVLRGWRLHYLNDVIAPAELPVTMSAFKNQQSRWAQGATECLLKFRRDILADDKHTWIARFYALFSMGVYWAHLFVLLILLVQVPLILLKTQPSLPPLWLLLASLGQPLLLVTSQRGLYRDWWRPVRYLPALLLMAIGLAPANSRAVVQAAIGRGHKFVRTPKGLATSHRPGPVRGLWPHTYRLPFDWIIVVEIGLALYAGFGLALCLKQGIYGPVIFLASCVLGFAYVGLASVRDLAAASTNG